MIINRVNSNICMCFLSLNLQCNDVILLSLNTESYKKECGETNSNIVSGHTNEFEKISVK